MYVLVQVQPSQTLFPHLRRLRWDIDSAECSALLSLLRTSTLEELEIHIIHPVFFFSNVDVQQWQAAFLPVLLYATSTCKRISSLTLSIGRLYTSALIPIILAFSRLNRLALECDCEADDGSNEDQRRKLSTEDVVQLGHHCNLQRLLLDCNVAHVDVDIASYSETTMFHNLVAFSVEDHGEMASIYKVLSNAPLKELHVTNLSHSNEYDLSQRSRLWATSFPALQSFRCDLTFGYLSDTNDTHLPLRHLLLDALQPLLHLPLIDDVDIEYPDSTYTVDDNDIISIAHKWPLLRRLRLRSYPSHRDAISYGFGALLTPRSLSTLALHCHSLHTLVLPHIYIPPNMPISIGSTHRLSIISVRCAVIPDYAFAARLVHCVFPSLHVEHLDSMFRDSSAEWVRLLQNIQEYRRKTSL